MGEKDIFKKYISTSRLNFKVAFVLVGVLGFSFSEIKYRFSLFKYLFTL